MFRKIVVPVDFSECSQVAALRAATLAKQCSAKIHLVHAVPPISYPAPMEFSLPNDFTGDLTDRSREKLSEWATRLRQDGCEVSEAVTNESCVDSICGAVEGEYADLIVMGSHGYTGLKHAFLGSVAERTLRVAPCPVMTVKGTLAEAAEPIRRALLCTDFSAHAEVATELAINLCKALNAELHVAHVVQGFIPIYGELPPPPDYLDRLRGVGKEKLDGVKARIEAAGLDGSTNLLAGEASLELIELAKRHALDLVILGTRGNTGFKHVALGSVAERVLRQVSPPVLTVRAADDA